LPSVVRKYVAGVRPPVTMSELRRKPFLETV
jgi:hypothetical protein